jgi:hypothetical protein
MTTLSGEEPDMSVSWARKLLAERVLLVEGPGDVLATREVAN